MSAIEYRTCLTVVLEAEKYQYGREYVDPPEMVEFQTVFEGFLSHPNGNEECFRSLDAL